MTTETTTCPRCQSQSIHYRFLSKVWACPQCGPIVPEESEDPSAPLAPCRVCGKHAEYSAPKGGLVCGHCGSNQARRPKSGHDNW